MKNFEKLEDGKIYRLANGEIGIAELLDPITHMYPFCINNAWYTPYGYYYGDEREHPFNVVECLDVEQVQTLNIEEAIELLKANGYKIFK